MKMHDFEVIPAGRIMFVPALVWRAAHQEQDQVQQDSRLSESTRMHLLAAVALFDVDYFTKGVPPIPVTEAPKAATLGLALMHLLTSSMKGMVALFARAAAKVGGTAQANGRA